MKMLRITSTGLIDKADKTTHFDFPKILAAVYQLSGGEIVKVKGSGGVSPPEVDLSVRRAEAIYAQGWYDSITHDMFG